MRAERRLYLCRGCPPPFQIEEAADQRGLQQPTSPLGRTTMLPTKHRSLRQQWGFAILLVLLSSVPIGAQTYQDSDDSVVEPFQCWSSATFYSHKNPPYYEFRDTGYYFDPNPFQLRTYLGGRQDWAEMWPATGSRTLKSVNASKAWELPSITVQCYVRKYWWGFNQTFMVVRSEDGFIKDLSVACGGGSPGPFLNEPYAASYDPSDPYGSTSTTEGCTGGGGTGMGGGGAGGCQSVFLTIEVSHDGGNTWSTYWEGWATVCS